MAEQPKQQLDIVFATVEMMGHLNPLLPYMEELLDRGHAVTCFHDSDPKFRRKLVACGLERCTSVPCELKGHNSKCHRPGSGPLYDSIVDHYKAKGTKPDVVVYDFFAAAAADAGDYFGSAVVNVFPNASVSINPWALAPGDRNFLYPAWCSFMDLIEAAGSRVWLLLRNRDRAARALPPMEEQDLWPCRTMKRLTIGCTGLGLEFAVHAKSPLFHMVGPSLASGAETLSSVPDLAQWIDQQSKPLVYVAFGTDYTHTQKSVQCLQRQLASVDCAVLWSLPDKQQKWLEAPLGQSLRVEKFVPQVAVLGCGQVKAFVSHCGSNSLYEALLHKVPIVCCPGFADQPPNARRLAMAGVGVISRGGVAGVGNALNLALEDHAGMVARSVTLCSLLATLGGKARAATIIEDCGKSGYSHLVSSGSRTSWSRYIFSAIVALSLVFYRRTKSISN